MSLTELGIKIKVKVLLSIAAVYNRLFIAPHQGKVPKSTCPEFEEIRERAKIRTDFSDHLPTLFAEALRCRPKLIVELGTRGGDSTFVLERAAKICGSAFVSVDIEDCSAVGRYPGWVFVQKDDIAFAAEFKSWCATRHLGPLIDLLFIDTSHEYRHTVREIAAWFPHLASDAKVIFHDTNLKFMYFRKDGSVGFAWNNQRGVIRALEEYLGVRYAENQDFIDVQRSWLIRHQAYCSGLTVLDRLG